MSNPFGAALRSFWHTMTSNDRHSTIDSPHRSGRHVPLSDSRNSLFTGVATASDSRADVSSPYFDENHAPLNRESTSNGAPYTPSSPANGAYSPGLRSMAAKNTSQPDGFEVQSPGDVPMQSFEDGLPPAPPVAHSWRRIDEWAEDNYPELFDQVCEGATINDINELEHQLDASLPQDVRESLMIHDGQERGGNPTGIIFSSMLLDCEEIVQEWEQWARVNQQFLMNATAAHTTQPSRTFNGGGGSSEASSSKQRPSSSHSSNPDEWRQNLLDRQTSMPPNSVRKAYAHTGWIPLVRDWGGNNLAVDLSPGPKGKWGQIILFGRDYDTKYVVARSWAHFLAVVADDLNSGKWFVDEDTMELKLREFKDARVEPAYFNILRWRMDQKYGRRAAQRKSMAPRPQSGSPLGSRSSSPYAAAPAEGSQDARGRSMQRLRGTSPLTSPMRTGHGKLPPLSRVTEEMTIPEVPTGNIQPSTLIEAETLVENEERTNANAGVSTSTNSNRNSVKGPKATLTRVESDLIKLKDKENESPKAAKPVQVTDETMKDIEI